ncbi:MAG: hypothetical protein AB1584_09310 [Pseudomonadota bacterium]
MNPATTRRLHIERLELDLRGLDPAAAEAAVRQLGPALARALAAGGATASPAHMLDAGTIASPARPAPDTLAGDIAKSLARRIQESTP